MCVVFHSEGSGKCFPHTSAAYKCMNCKKDGAMPIDGTNICCTLCHSSLHGMLPFTCAGVETMSSGKESLRSTNLYIRVILLKPGHYCDIEVENLKFDIFYFLYCR